MIYKYKQVTIPYVEGQDITDYHMNTLNELGKNGWKVISQLSKTPKGINFLLINESPEPRPHLGPR